MHKRLKVLMFERDITQRQLADIIGINISTLNGKISGKREFTLSEINKIITYFNLSFEQIFFANKVIKKRTA